MKLDNKLLASLVMMMTITGCGISTDRYQPTADNQQALKNIGVEMNVGKFTATKSDSKVLCRLANNVEMPDGITFEQYIEGALVEELKMAGLFNPGSKIVINGNLNDVDVSSGMTSAHWTLDVTLSNGLGSSFNIVKKREYRASFIGGIACGNDMPKAFMPTVQELINEIINNPEFGKLFGASGA